MRENEMRVKWRVGQILFFLEIGGVREGKKERGRSSAGVVPLDLHDSNPTPLFSSLLPLAGDDFLSQLLPSSSIFLSTFLQILSLTLLFWSHKYSFSDFVPPCEKPKITDSTHSHLLSVDSSLYVKSFFFPPLKICRVVRITSRILQKCSCMQRMFSVRVCTLLCGLCSKIDNKIHR